MNISGHESILPNFMLLFCLPLIDEKLFQTVNIPRTSAVIKIKLKEKTVSILLRYDSDPLLVTTFNHPSC